MSIQYWLLKSEPHSYSWQQMQDDKITMWDGVRNHQAKNNLKAMKLGDLAFFYHSNEGKEIVGITKVVKEFYPDPTDESGKFVVVDFMYLSPLNKIVSLTEIKSNPRLEQIALVKQSRLSVMPITALEWKEILKMAETDITFS